MSIRTKISGLLVILVFLLMAGTGFMIIRLVRNSFLEEIKLRGIILARNVAFSAEDPLMVSDDLTLTVLSRNALHLTGSVYAYILNQENITAASPARLVRRGDSTEIVLEENLWRKEIKQAIAIPEDAPYAAKTVNDAQWGAIYEVAVPVMLGGQKKIGEVHVGIDLTSLQVASRKIQMVVGIVAIIGIAVGILGAFGLGTLLIRPLKALVTGVAEIARGNFDFRIKKRTNDEIGDLTTAFNIMAKDLKDKVLIEDAFKRYVSHQVADEILKDPDVFAKSLKGEKRKITAFFGDIRGFTTISENLPPEEVVAFLNSYLTDMTTIIFANEGTIDKFMGDCIMAIFGAPVIHSDDVFRAVKSGVEIQKKIENLNKQRLSEGQRDIHVGIGINYGEAVVGNIGSTQRLEYTVIGDSVNTASRIQNLAAGGEIVVTESVYQEVKEFFDFVPMEPVKVKGKAKTLIVWKIALPTCTPETYNQFNQPPSPQPEPNDPEPLDTPSLQPE